MLQRVRVSVCSEQPTVPERDSRQVVALSRTEDDARLSGEREVATEHRVRATSGEEGCKLLRSRHGSNAIGSSRREAGMGPSNRRVP